MRGGEKLFSFPPVRVPAAVQRSLVSPARTLDWPLWYRESTTMEDALETKALRKYLLEHELCLDEVAEHVWSCSKSFLPAPAPCAQWAGFSRFVAILPDPDEGYWLEVPGATCSLWSPDVGVLAQLLAGPVTPDLAVFLTAHGFDGRALPTSLHTSSTLQDWLWWESTRFLDRLGPLSHVVAQKIPDLVVPTGSTQEHVAPTLARNPRQSVREHEERRPVTRDELLTLLGKVFGHTEGRHSPWHGMVHRNYGASGGGAWEECGWLWVNAASGLSPGLYRFNGQERNLEMHPLDATRSAFWQQQAKKAWGRPGAPQAVVAVVADFSKLPRKYYRLSQQLAHLNTGLRTAEVLALADELGLASCALGGGIMRDLALQLELSPLLLSPVCEIAIGGQAQ